MSLRLDAHSLAKFVNLRIGEHAGADDESARLRGAGIIRPRMHR
jgi:hypothetical protein